MNIEPMATPIAIIDKTPIAGVNYRHAAVAALLAELSSFIINYY